MFAWARKNNGHNETSWENRRKVMVEKQIYARGVQDVRILQALEKIPRHEFVPPEEVPRAYDDGPLPIGYGQTISQPYIVGFMTELLQVGVDHKVLELGTGSGYQTAVLAEVAREVFTIEIIEPFVESARQRLERLGYDNVRFQTSDGYEGWPEEAPFDRIIVTAGVTQIPDTLVQQLSVGGRMVIPVGAVAGDQMLQVVTREDAFRVDVRDIVPVRFVPLTRKMEWK